MIQVYDVKTGKLTNLRQAVGTGFSFSGNLLAFSVSEADQGNRDLNGDGDTDDEIVTIYDAATGRLVTTRQACSDTIVTSARAAVWLTSEADQGNHDLNGDGDTDDMVCQYYRMR